MSERDNLEISGAEETAVKPETVSEVCEHGDVSAQVLETAADVARKPLPTSAPDPEKEKDAHAGHPTKAFEDFALELLLDIPLEIKVELGRTKIRIRELLKLAPGSAIKLTTLDGECVNVLANDRLIAKGEVVVQKEKYGIRITEIASRSRRCDGLRT